MSEKKATEEMNLEKSTVDNSSASKIEVQYEHFCTFMKTFEKELDDMYFEINESMAEIIMKHVDLINKIMKQDEEFKEKYDNVLRTLDKVIANWNDYTE